MDNWLLGGVIVYLILQVGICIVAGRFIKSEADYLLAGRNLGTFLLTMSVFASWFGAETIIGSSGAIAKEGLAGGRGEPIGYTLCLLLMGFLLVMKLREKAYITLGDFFAEQYGRSTEILGSLIIIPTSIIWSAAQLQAFAVVLSMISPLPVEAGLIIAMVVVIIYTCLGGLLGDVLTDLVQGTVMTIGLLVLLGFVFQKAGGPQAAFALIQPQQLEILGHGESWLSQIDAWAIPILGSLVAPEAISRTLAARDALSARRACLSGAAVYFVVGCVPVLIALIGSHLITIEGTEDAFLPSLVKATMPTWVTVLFLGAIISAILSVINTTLLSVSAMASHNIIQRMMKTPPDEKTKVWMARGLVGLAGFIACWIATSGSTVYELVQAASAFGSAGFLVCVLGGLYLPGVSIKGANVVLLAGVLFTLLFDYGLKVEGSYILAVLGCVFIYLTFLWAEKARQIAI